MTGKGQGNILIVDADTESAQRIGLAFDSAGFSVGWTNYSPNEVLGMLRDFKPDLLLVRGELGSAQVSTLLARMEATPTARLPLVLLAKEVIDEAFTRAMKSGVVEMLQEPFNPRLHVGRVRAVLTELPARTGQVRGRGGPGEMQAIIQHIVRTRRTGCLAVGSAGSGIAYFVRGVLTTARHQDESLHVALGQLSRSHEAWVFTEGAEERAIALEFEELKPYSVTDSKATLPPASDEPPDIDRGWSYSQPGAGSAPPAAVRASAPPRAPGPAPASAPPPVAAPLPAAPPLSPSPAVDPNAAATPILFVDDEAAVVTMMSDYFQRRGYPVSTARDGVEALEQLVTKDFEVVIADLNMPRLDGWGLLRFLREDFRTHEVPVALYSAHDDYRESLRLLHAGAQAFFPKTLRLSALEAQVRELVEPRRRFVRLVNAQASLAFDFGTLGPQWVLRALASLAFSGQLDARDAWATWRGSFEGGRLVSLTSSVAGTTLSGDAALRSFLSSRQTAGTLSEGRERPAEGFAGQPTLALVARIVAKLNEEHGRAREDQLARAKALTVNPELYRLYVTVGPPAWLPMARLLCEQQLTPAEVISRMQVAPAEVAAVVKDMLRRGVVGLSA